MSTVHIQEERLNALVEMYLDREQDVAPQPHRLRFIPFEPSLNPIQRQVYKTGSKFILAYGERGSGKTLGALHKLVRHCRMNRDALAILIVGVRRQAEEGGAWDKLLRKVLPVWKKGCGLEWTQPRYNASKDTFIWITNRYGAWSKVILLSMPVEGFVTDRIKGMEPSFVLVDEAQTLKSATYFNDIVQQLTRRENINEGEQQIVYCCNPAGPSHWLYQRFFVIPHDKERGLWNEDYAVFHVPIRENIQNLPRGYYETVLEAVRGDDTEYRRMVLGEWVDAPAGDAIFKGYWDDRKHLVGDARRGVGIVPFSRVPIICGWDPGSAHCAVSFQQNLIDESKNLWTIFDEVVTVDQRMPYRRLVSIVLSRMEYWNQRCKTEFKFKHISDASAFNQFRAATGSYDHLDIEKLSEGKIHFLEAPMGSNSVPYRVRITREKLEDRTLLVSATCPKTKEMFLNLEEDPKDRTKPLRSRYIHVFDSDSYPHHYYQSGLASGRKITAEEVAPPQVYTISA